jgi:hypothetical protein
MAIQMGLGKLGGDQVTHKRKFRWTFEVRRSGGVAAGNDALVGGTKQDVPASFVKMAARPNISIEETEINFLNGKTYIPGKGTWETVTVTYYDVSGDDNMPLWDWLADVYNFTDPLGLQQNARRNCYAGIGICTMYTGCGDPMERWTLGDCWPQAVNFGELDYSSSEEATVEVTVRYGNVSYKNLCGRDPLTSCCACSTQSGGVLGMSAGADGATTALPNVGFSGDPVR